MVLQPIPRLSRRSPRARLKQLLQAMMQLLMQSTGTLPTGRITGRKDASRNGQSLTVADKRQNPRIQLTRTTVHVTDGCLSATALIDNISLCGICLCNLPEQLYRSARQLTVFSSDNPGIPILHIQPKWENTGWEGKTIGATILNTSESWRLFFAYSADRTGS